MLRDEDKEPQERRWDPWIMVCDHGNTHRSYIGFTGLYGFIYLVYSDI